MNAREIIAEARRNGLDPVEHASDIGDGYGWGEDMTRHAMETVARLTAASSGVK